MYRIHVNRSPKAEFDVREIALELAAAEAQRAQLVELFSTDSRGGNQKLIKRWRNGKEVR